MGEVDGVSLKDNASLVKPNSCITENSFKMLRINEKMATICDKYNKYRPSRQTIVLEKKFHVTDRAP